jgi:hypothetical protein
LSFAFVAFAVLVCTVLFALAAGGKVERIGAAIVIANVLLAGAAWGLFGAPSLPVSLTLDIGTAVAFGLLAVRNPEKLWPGVAGVAMTFVMVFSATRAIGFPLSDLAYSTALNLSGLLVQGALAAGAWNHRFGRHRPDEPELAGA